MCSPAAHYLEFVFRIIKVMKLRGGAGCRIVLFLCDYAFTQVNGSNTPMEEGKDHQAQ